jgi:hypothetical protein
MARIAAVARRRCARGAVDDLERAVADIQAVAQDRSDLLAEHAGISVGWAQEVTPAEAPFFWAEAELCRAAGADQSAIDRWVETGRRRARSARTVPYAGR